MSRAKILLVEDHALVGQSLAAQLRPTYDVAAVVADGRDVLPAVERHGPDLVLLDLTLPGRSGLDLLPDLVREHPALRILIVTMHASQVYLELALSLGAHGFVPKNASVRELRQAIAQVLHGEQYISARIHPRDAQDPEPDPMGFSRLTPRQQQIVRLLGEGLTTDEVARRVQLTNHTIHFHRKRIRTVLGLANDWELRRYAMLVGLARPLARGETE